MSVVITKVQLHRFKTKYFINDHLTKKNTTDTCITYIWVSSK